MNPLTIQKFNPFTDGFHETGNQVHAWVLAQARRHFAAAAARKAEWTDRAAFEAHRLALRAKYRALIGEWVDAQGDPSPQETGRIQRDGFAIRKLVYRGRSGVYVAANLYVPDGLSAPAPGVLMVCGHSREGKAAPKYQQVCRSLVDAGFVVLILDSPGHGELVQCLDTETGEPSVGINCAEHSHLQRAASVLGQNIMRVFIDNARAGLDLLCGLPEVDAQWIGATGNSGGGHLTQALLMTDDRVRAALSCCSQTTREHYLDNGVRAYDGEQNIFGCIPGGLDYDDFFSVFAPRPLRIGAAAHDYFAIEGVLEAMERARRVYGLYGAEDNLSLCLAEDEKHGYTAPLRKGCVEWFSRHLLGRPAGPVADDPPVESMETLQCTRSGQVRAEYPDAPSVMDLFADEWRQARAGGQARPALTRKALRAKLGLPGTVPPPEHVRRTVCMPCADSIAERIFFFSEPGIAVTGVVYRPKGKPAGAVLLLIPDGTEGQGPYADLMARHVRAGRLVLVFDPRGTGAVRMRRRNPGEGLDFRGTEFRVANDHFMLGTSMAARRAFDVLCALSYLRARPEWTDGLPLEVEAHGWPALYGLMAAAADGDVAGSRFEGLPETWADVFTDRPHDRERLSEPLLLPELRGEADIPDLQALVKGEEGENGRDGHVSAPLAKPHAVGTALRAVRGNVPLSQPTRGRPGGPS